MLLWYEPRLHLDHMFAVVFGVSCQALAARVDDPVHQFEWYLPDCDRKFVGYLGNIANAIATLYAQPNRTENRHKITKSSA